MPNPSRGELPIVQAMIDLIRWFVPLLNGLPRSVRFTAQGLTRLKVYFSWVGMNRVVLVDTSQKFQAGEHPISAAHEFQQALSAVNDIASPKIPGTRGALFQPEEEVVCPVLPQIRRSACAYPSHHLAKGRSLQ